MILPLRKGDLDPVFMPAGLAFHKENRVYSNNLEAILAI
jgi:hypothetical protein